MSDIALNCVFDGETVQEIFAVRLPLDRSVGYLKEKIKKTHCVMLIVILLFGR